VLLRDVKALAVLRAFAACISAWYLNVSFRSKRTPSHLRYRRSVLSDTIKEPVATKGELFLSACLREKYRSSDLLGSKVIPSDRPYSSACVSVAVRAREFS
jgi:hypothetical protein